MFPRRIWGLRMSNNICPWEPHEWSLIIFWNSKHIPSCLRSSLAFPWIPVISFSSNYFSSVSSSVTTGITLFRVGAASFLEPYKTASSPKSWLLFQSCRLIDCPPLFLPLLLPDFPHQCIACLTARSHPEPSMLCQHSLFYLAQFTKEKKGDNKLSFWIWSLPK